VTRLATLDLDVRSSSTNLRELATRSRNARPARSCRTYVDRVRGQGQYRQERPIVVAGANAARWRRSPGSTSRLPAFRSDRLLGSAWLAATNEKLAAVCRGYSYSPSSAISSGVNRTRGMSVWPVLLTSRSAGSRNSSRIPILRSCPSRSARPTRLWMRIRCGQESGPDDSAARSSSRPADDRSPRRLTHAGSAPTACRET